MPDNNTVNVVSLPEAVRLEPSLAVGISLPKLQHTLTTAGEEDAPHFPEAHRPTADGTFYLSSDGRTFYRPNLRVAASTVAIGPDVWFLKDDQRVVRLQFTLEEAPMANKPEGALPFAVRVDAVRLESNSSHHTFSIPTIELHPSPAPNDPTFTLRIGEVLQADTVQGLKHVLEGRDGSARMVVDLSYGYWADQSTPQLPRPVPIPPIIKLPPIVIAFPKGPRPPIKITGTTFSTGLASERVAVDAIALEDRVADDEISPPGRRDQLIPDISGVVTEVPEVLVSPHIRELLVAHRIDAIERRIREREQEPQFRRVTLTRIVPFVFDPELPEHRHIYLGITAAPQLGQAWTDTGAGWARSAGFTNTVFRLPDELRLAFDTDLGIPYMIPTIYQDDKGNNRVRVVLRALPWQKPADVVRLRDAIGTAPRIAVGGYESATLKLTGAFPEQVKTLDTEPAIELESGVQLTVDVSEEFYRWLCEVLTGQLGITGDITVRLQTLTGADGTLQPLHKRVPARINFDDVAMVPLPVRIAADTISPTKFELVNNTKVPITISECIPRLLQYDSNSVLPLAVYDASCITALPVDVPAGGSATIELKPNDDNPGLLWNALLVELVDQKVAFEPERALARIHEIAPSGTLTWKVEVSCPLFTDDAIPEEWTNLHKLEVEIIRQGRVSTRVVLGWDKPTDQVTMDRTLQDLVSEEAAAIGSFTYRVRNIYKDHTGEWSQQRTEEGTNLFVFPNPREGD